jgi:hypothetical protein
MPWDLLLSIGVTKLNLSPESFWNLTFGEWWPIYNAAFGREKPMTASDVAALEKEWTG